MSLSGRGAARPARQDRRRGRVQRCAAARSRSWPPYRRPDHSDKLHKVLQLVKSNGREHARGESSRRGRRARNSARWAPSARTRAMGAARRRCRRRALSSSECVQQTSSCSTQGLRAEVRRTRARPATRERAGVSTGETE
eukprot:1516842-Prymnesium_polylepis.3